MTGVFLQIATLLAATALMHAAAFDELAARARTARESGRLEDAISAYRQALEQKPDWNEGRWFYAVSLYEAKQYEPAAKAFETVTQVAPKTGAGWILRGLCEFELKNYQPAFEHLTQGRKLGAQPELLATSAYYLALLMNHFGEFEAATQLLLPFGARDNASPTVIEAFGLAMLRRMYFPSEIPAAERDSIEQAGRAAFLMASKRAAEGRRVMEKLVAARPENLDVRYAYGSMLIESDPEAAIEQFRIVLSKNPEDYHAHATLGTLLNKARRYDEALIHLETARRLREHALPPRYQIAVAQLATGSTKEALGLLEEITQEAPEFTAAHVTLATVYYRLNRKEDGDRERALVRKLNEQPPQKSADAAPLGSSSGREAAP